MANPLRFCRENLADAAVIGGTHEITSLPFANLKDDDIQKIWRSTTDSTQHIVADLGGQKTIGPGVVALINVVNEPASWAVRASTSDPTGLDGDAYAALSLTPVFDPAYNKFVHFIESAVIGRYVRINFTNPTGVPEAGRLVIGAIWAPSRDMQFGWEPLWRDFSRRSRSLGGNTFIDVGPRQRGFRFTLKALTQNEAQNQVDELNRLRGIGRDILVCRDKEASNLGYVTVWGLLEEPARQRQDQVGYVVEFEVWDRI